MFKPRWHRVNAFEEDDLYDGYQKIKRSPKWTMWRAVILIGTSLFVVIILSASGGYWLARQNGSYDGWDTSKEKVSHTHTQHQDIQEATDCGSSVAEAHQKACLFDPISFSWLPPACFDAELISSFLQLKKWNWYSEMANSTEDLVPVPFHAVAQGRQHHLWVTREFHLYHCTFQWRKMHRAILRNRPLDGYIGNYTHTEHCEHVLTKEVLELGMDIVDVQIQRKFTTCAKDDPNGLYQPSS